jgi:site-specific DNA recombinase
MAHRLDPPLTPRNGITLRVLAVCRISGLNQDLKALEDQEALYRRYVADHHDGPTDWEVFATRSSGELLDRRELFEISERIDSRRWDLLITEDLGRIARRHHAIVICEAAEDSGTRLIALNDHVDTGRGDWQTSAMFATLRHEQYNKDTAKRIRRSMRNRFVTQGLIQSIQYGYIKPAGVKTDDKVAKEPAAGPIYEEWFRRLESGASFSEIVDFLNDLGIKPGPSSQTGRWSVSLVRNMTYNPILKGVRVRNRKMSMRINKTGRHRSVDAPPEELLERPVPHLAFIDAARYDRVVAMLRRRNSNRGRKPVNGSDPRLGVPRRRTSWPGQHVRCGVCGRLFYFGGHGRTDHLECSGARLYRCWLGTTFSGPLAAERITSAILAEVASLPEFDATFLDLLREKYAAARAVATGRSTELDRLQQNLGRQIVRVMALLIDGEPSPALREKLRELESERDRIVVERAELGDPSDANPELPSMARIKASFAGSFGDLSRGSEEFGRLMHRVVPRLEVRPFRLIDGGNAVLRAFVTVELASLVAEARGLEGAAGPLRRELVVDLFDPPQRVVNLALVRDLKAAGRTQRQIAAELGITQPAVQRTAALGREMVARGLEDPYEAMTGPTEGSGRDCRHLHRRYRFEPLDRERPDQEVRDGA